MNNDRIDAIIKYNMTDLEAKAFKVCMLWEKYTKQEFPDLPVIKVKKLGDPRKSHLFRYCYKLVRETTGLIPDNEYKHYVLAQLHIIKSFKDDKNIHGMVDCQILVGDRAWKRWKVWKKYYDRQYNQPVNEETLDIHADEKKVLAELTKTKEFLYKEFKKHPSAIDYEPLISDLTLIRWLTLGKMSPYYALLSPTLQKALGDQTVEERFAFDLGVYKRAITEDIRRHFNQMFPEEVSNSG